MGGRNKIQNRQIRTFAGGIVRSLLKRRPNKVDSIPPIVGEFIISPRLLYRVDQESLPDIPGAREGEANAQSDDTACFRERESGSSIYLELSGIWILLLSVFPEIIGMPKTDRAASNTCTAWSRGL